MTKPVSKSTFFAHHCSFVGWSTNKTEIQLRAAAAGETAAGNPQVFLPGWAEGVFPLPLMAALFGFVEDVRMAVRSGRVNEGLVALRPFGGAPLAGWAHRA